MKSKWLGNRSKVVVESTGMKCNVPRILAVFSDEFLPPRFLRDQSSILNSDGSEFVCICWTGCFKLYKGKRDEQLTTNLNWCRISCMVSQDMSCHWVSGCYLVTILKNASNKWIFQSKNTTSLRLCVAARRFQWFGANLDESFKQKEPWPNKDQSFIFWSWLKGA